MKPLKKTDKPPQPKPTHTVLGKKDIDASDGALQRLRLQLLTLPQREEVRNQRIRLLIDLATIYWRRVEYPAAISVWKQIITLTQTDKDPMPLALAYTMLSTIYAHSGEIANAVENAKRGLIYAPQDPNIMYGLANAYDFAGEEEQVLKWLRRILATHPDFDKAYEQMSRIHLRHSEFALAEQYLRKALAIDPTSDTALNELGNLLVYLERFEEALVQYKTSQEVNPDRSTAFNNIGYCYYRWGNLKEAKRWMERRIEVNVTDAISAYIVLGVIARNVPGDKARAESDAHFDKAMEVYKSKKAHLMGNRLIEHDACRALILTGLGDEAARAAWQFVLASPDTKHVNPLPWTDWLYCLRLLAQSPHATPQANEMIEMLKQYLAENGPTF